MFLCCGVSSLWPFLSDLVLLFYVLHDWYLGLWNSVVSSEVDDWFIVFISDIDLYMFSNKCKELEWFGELFRRLKYCFSWNT